MLSEWMSFLPALGWSFREVFEMPGTPQLLS